jgi:hypothetical protein
MPAGTEVPAGLRLARVGQGEGKMKHFAANRIRVCTAGAWLCLVVAVTPATAQETGFPVDAEGFRQLRIAPGLSKGATVADVMAPLMRHFPGEEEGRPGMTLEMVRIGGNVRFDLVETGFADDSVAGQHHRGVIVRSGTDWELIELGVRPVCARGSLSPEGRCP